MFCRCHFSAKAFHRWQSSFLTLRRRSGIILDILGYGHFNLIKLGIDKILIKNLNNPYPQEYKHKRNEIIERDDNKCRMCFSKLDLCVHHIDYDKNNNIEKNLITLCRKCNLKVNSNRNIWETKIMGCFYATNYI